MGAGAGGGGGGVVEHDAIANDNSSEIINRALVVRMARRSSVVLALF
jgi:hypothetical protein